MRKHLLAAALLSLASCKHQQPDPSPSPAPAPAPAPEAPAPRWVDASPLRPLLERLDGLRPTTVDACPSLPEPAQAGGPALTADGGKLEFALAHTAVHARVTGNLARVEMTQLYQNPTDRRLEATYAFPLPENAAVTDMLFRIGNRVVMSEVKRREEARRTYEQARDEGRTAALTEQERPNLFTQSVANIPPGASVEVVIRYVHEVKYDDGRYLFVVPTTVGPRYLPAGVADAERIAPRVVPAGVASAHDLEIVVELQPGAAFTAPEARNHRIRTALAASGERMVALAADDRVPNKDFILSYRPAGREPDARLLVEKERGDDYMMLFVQPPAEVAAAQVRPKEMVFLLDKSGSMSGRPIETAEALITRALDRMGADDTFQIVAFDSAAATMSPQPLPNTVENVRAAKAWLGTLGGGGGTEMMAGVRAALDPPADPKRLRMVVFCTDGFIGNETEIIGEIDRRRGEARVFGFGIGSSVNRYLIEGVARAGRGAAEYVGERESPEQAVARLYKRLDRPLLTDLALAYDGIAPRESEPEQLPDLFAGQPLTVVAKLAHAPGRSPSVTLTGRLGAAAWERRIAVDAIGDSGGAPVLGTLWARRRIAALGDRAPYQVADADRAEIERLGLAFKLVTQYTSFVAVERELRVDPHLPLAQVVVPNELPEGVSREGIFGDATEVSVTPARVKPGDPEIRVPAARSARRVRVWLPFDAAPVEAVRDFDAPGEWVARFLVPSGWPDGSYPVRIAIDHDDGAREEREGALRVDTRAAAIAVVGAPEAAPGGELTVAVKPALPLGTLAATLGDAGRAGGVGHALKGAMDVKEVLVRAPWGEIGRAEMGGPIGAWTATLHVPADQPAGKVALEIVASDGAGNVSRRAAEAEIGGGGSSHTALWLAVIGLAAALVLRRRAGA